MFSFITDSELAANVIRW